MGIEEWEEKELQEQIEAEKWFGKDFVQEFEKIKKDLLDKETFMYFHGTNLESAKKILEKGLQYDRPSIRVTSYDYSDYKRLRNWPHKDYKYLVIIGVPLETTNFTLLKENENPDLELPVKEPKPLWKFDDEIDGLYNIPPEFIFGYIDVNKKSIVKNPRYTEKHNYENVFIHDIELGRTPEIDESFFGIDELEEIDSEVTPFERKKAVSDLNDVLKEQEVLENEIENGGDEYWEEW